MTIEAESIAKENACLKKKIMQIKRNEFKYIMLAFSFGGVAGAILTLVVFVFPLGF